MQDGANSSISLRSTMWTVASKDLNAWLRMCLLELKAPTCPPTTSITRNQTEGDEDEDEDEDENEDICEGTSDSS
jgi:hypothetical protein